MSEGQANAPRTKEVDLAVKAFKVLKAFKARARMMIMSGTETANGRWVRISDLARESEWAELLATAIQELAVAQTLVMMHGPDRGLERYVSAGGRVRFEPDGQPVIWASA